MLGTNLKIENKWWVSVVVLTGTFMGGLNTYIVNVSLPTIARKLHADRLSWTVVLLRSRKRMR